MQELKDAKAGLTRKLDELEYEKSRLQSQAQSSSSQSPSAAVGALDEIEVFLREDSDLSENRRTQALLPVHRKAAAEVGRCHQLPATIPHFNLTLSYLLSKPFALKYACE